MYVQYPMAEKKLAELLHLEDEAIPEYPVFDKHVYLRHDLCSWQGSHSLPYYIYLISSSYAPKHALAFL